MALAVQRVSASPHHATSDLAMSSLDKSNNQRIVEPWASSSETWLVARCCSTDEKNGSVPKPRWMEYGSQTTGHWHLSPSLTRHRTLSRETVQFLTMAGLHLKTQEKNESRNNCVLRMLQARGSELGRPVNGRGQY